MTNKNFVLILTKPLSLPGGITNFYRIIKKNYKKKDIKIKFFHQGPNKKHDEIRKIEYIITYISNLVSFLGVLKNSQIKIIQVNPSFHRIPIIRDAPYIILSKLFRKKIICVFHGWDINYEYMLMKKRVKRYLFSRIYNKIDIFYVLSKDFKKSLQTIGIKSEIRIIKTIFDGESFQFSQLKKDPQKIIYLGRLQKEKGILTILKALAELKNKKINFRMVFAGWFAKKKFEKDFQKKIDYYNLRENIEYKGYLEGEDKKNEFQTSSIFVFPSESEGCPTVIIEALASGLYVLTTDVGALKEIIKDEKNGKIIRSGDYKNLSSNLEWCLNNYEEVKLIGLQNKKYAFKNFESKVIINTFYRDYINLIGGKNEYNNN